jgi:hypothetical protein
VGRWGAATAWALFACAPIACSQLEGLDQYQACLDCTGGSAPSDDAGAAGDGREESGGDEGPAPAADAGNDGTGEAGSDGAVGAPDGGGNAGATEAGGGGDGGRGIDGGDAGDGGTLSVGLVAFYPFDETSGTTAADASGNGHTATLSGGATFASGLRNNAVTLSGSNEYVSLPSGIVSGLSSFSICTWVKASSAPQWARIFDFGTGTNTYMFLTPNSGSGTRFAITTGGNGQEQQLNATALATGSWQHVAVTGTGNTGTLYVNGAEVAQSTTVTLSPMSLGSTTQNWIGRSQYAADPYLTGQIDNFRIYDRALSAAEVQALFAGDL